MTCPSKSAWTYFEKHQAWRLVSEQMTSRPLPRVVPGAKRAKQGPDNAVGRLGEEGVGREVDAAVLLPCMFGIFLQALSRE